MIDWVADWLARVMPSFGKATQFERRLLMLATVATQGNARPAERKWGP
jgi:hypothetical protein